MLTGIRYEKGHGNNQVYARARNQISQFWNFSTLIWVNTESVNTKRYLNEYSDLDPIDSLYSADIQFPLEDSVREVVDNTGLVIGIEVFSMTVAGELTLAQIEASTVLAKQSTVSQLSTDMNQVVNSLAQVIINTSGSNLQLSEAILGNWEILNKQMIFYKQDGTELMRFNLFDKFGNPSDHNVMKRVKV